METLKKFETPALIVALVLAALDGFFWFGIFFTPGPPGAHEYFLDVGQGDSELMIFGNGARIMIDAGPDGSVVGALAGVLGGEDRSIDLAVVSHPEADHFGGYQYLLDGGYRFGAFIYNGRGAAPEEKAWARFVAALDRKHIPLVTLGAPGAIRSGTDKIDVLSPGRTLAGSAATNDTALVLRAEIGGVRTLLTADVGAGIEAYLLDIYRGSGALRADILKVGHHGSKYSSGESFLRAVAPRLAVIEVGEGNSYGHPAKETLGRLDSFTAAAIVRTDEKGTIAVSFADGEMKATAGKP